MFLSVFVDIYLVLVVVDAGEELGQRCLCIEEGQPVEVVFLVSDFQQGEDGMQSTTANESVLQRIGVNKWA